MGIITTSCHHPCNLLCVGIHPRFDSSGFIWIYLCSANVPSIHNEMTRYREEPLSKFNSIVVAEKKRERARERVSERKRESQKSDISHGHIDKQGVLMIA